MTLADRTEEDCSMAWIFVTVDSEKAVAGISVNLKVVISRADSLLKRAEILKKTPESSSCRQMSKCWTNLARICLLNPFD